MIFLEEKQPNFISNMTLTIETKKDTNNASSESSSSSNTSSSNSNPVNDVEPTMNLTGGISPASPSPQASPLTETTLEDSADWHFVVSNSPCNSQQVPTSNTEHKQPATNESDATTDATVATPAPSVLLSESFTPPEAIVDDGKDKEKKAAAVEMIVHTSQDTSIGNGDSGDDIAQHAAATKPPRTNEHLQKWSNGGCVPELQDITLRLPSKNILDESKTTVEGTLQMHMNGLRFSSIRNKRVQVDVLFSNVQHFICQQCDEESHAVILHLRLKIPIELRLSSAGGAARKSGSRQVSQSRVVENYTKLQKFSTLDISFCMEAIDKSNPLTNNR